MSLVMVAPECTLESSIMMPLALLLATDCILCWVFCASVYILGFFFLFLFHFLEECLSAFDGKFEFANE